MKQLLFLLLFPCLAMAQYQGNANQKITLGEQTTADGLVYRGVASIDTVTATSKITRTNKQDTSTYILLDTVTNLLWHYKTASNGWIQAGGSTFDTTTLNLVSRFALKLNISDTSSMLTNYYRSGRALGTPLSGTLTNATGLPISTGLTGLGAANRIPYASSTTALTTSSGLTFDGTNFATTGTATATRFNPTGTSATGNGMYLPATNTLGFSTNGTEKVLITSAGNVGIGTSAPQSYTNYRILHLAGPATNGAGLLYLTNSDNSIVGMAFAEGGEQRVTYGSQTNHPVTFITYDTEKMRITSAGNVGIGTTNPLSKLNVMGTVRINSAAAPDADYYLQLENSSSQKAKAFAWETYSDKRIKTDIQPIFNAIDKVNLLNPVYYQKHDSYVENDFLNIDFDSSVKSLGFIAQEVYNVIPEAVNTGTTNELWAMDYTKIIPILTKAIQEQTIIIKQLEDRIKKLEEK